MQSTLIKLAQCPVAVQVFVSVKDFEARRAISDSLRHGSARLIKRARVLDTDPSQHAIKLAAEAAECQMTDHPRPWETVVDCMSRLVFRISETVFHQWETHLPAHASFDDIFDSGLNGLVVAVRKFDPDRGFALTTMAVPWIRTHVQRACYAQCGSARIPEKLLRQGLDPAAPLVASSTLSLDWVDDDGRECAGSDVAGGLEPEEAHCEAEGMSGVVSILRGIDERLPEIAGLMVDGLGDMKISEATGIHITRVGELRLAAQAALRQRGYASPKAD